VPAQPRRTAEAREADEGDEPLFLQLRKHATGRAADRHPQGLDVDLDDRPVEDAEHLDVRKPDEDLAHPSGVALKRVKDLLSRCHRASLAERLCRLADARPPSDPRCL
jgi:hypothetical protein